jgi:hypothetical protein
VRISIEHEAITKKEATENREQSEEVKQHTSWVGYSKFVLLWPPAVCIHGKHHLMTDEAAKSCHVTMIGNTYMFWFSDWGKISRGMHTDYSDILNLNYELADSNHD